MEPSYALIATIAYDFWEKRGCPEGDPDTDWFHAKKFLTGEISIIQPEPSVWTEPPVGTEPTEGTETVEVENSEVITGDWLALQAHQAEEKKPTFVEAVKSGAKKLVKDVMG
jgi:Protein of unknown function (DUF2934)